MKLNEVTKQKGADSKQPAAKKAPGGIVKGTVINKGGKDYQWAGALWVDTATNKPIGVANAMKMGLGNPKLDPIIAAAKKDPALSKLIKQQITSKGIKAGTAQAAKAAQPAAKNKVAPTTKATPKVTPTTKVAPKKAPKTKTTANVATDKKDSKLKKVAGALKGGYKNYNKLSALNPNS